MSKQVSRPRQIQSKPPGTFGRAKSVDQPVGPRPFNMVSLLLSTFFFSLVAGGAMAAINWRRLGKPTFAVPVIIVSVILFLLLGGLFSIFVVQPDAGFAWLTLLSVNSVFAAALIAWQRPFYLPWVERHGAIAPTLRDSGFFTYTLIVLLGVAALFVALQVTGVPVGQAILSLRSEQRIAYNGLSLTEPGAWLPLHPAYLQPEFCEATGSTCLYHATRLGTPILFGTRRLSGNEYAVSTPEQADTALWKAVQADMSDLKVVEVRTLQVDGKPAIRRVYTYPGYPAGRNARIIMLVKDSDKTFFQFDLIGEEPAVNQYFFEIEDIIRSLRFNF